MDPIPDAVLTLTARSTQVAALEAAGEVAQYPLMAAAAGAGEAAEAAAEVVLSEVTAEAVESAVGIINESAIDVVTSVVCDDVKNQSIDILQESAGDAGEFLSKRNVKSIVIHWISVPCHILLTINVYIFRTL